MKSWPLLRATLGLLLFLALRGDLFAGGPLLVNGNGVPITWEGGQITYYTDQGDLSPLLPKGAADQFVADAWSRWTSVPLAKLNVVHSGQLDEDVSGANVRLASGTVSLPNDVKPSSHKPLAVVYDADGKVTDALLGAGAGSPALCSTNSILEQIDREDDAYITHGLVVINGNCARIAGDLPILRYRLVRALGRILGLDYSQLNENIVSGSPPPTVDDYAGHPLMHPLGVLCSEVSGCVGNFDEPRMDDRAALARLYPAANFAGATGRIRGALRFADLKGTPAEGMQGVNVVARMLDPLSGRPSGRFAASCVSGFLFRGNAGNPMTGYLNALGERWDVHGASDLALQGSYDLSGLEIPDGYSSVTYEVSIEQVNALYTGNSAVGPYLAGQVSMTGSAPPIRVTVSAGDDVVQDFTVGAASELQDRWEPSSFAQPPSVPLEGNWSASISPYGDRDYLTFEANADRTFTLDVTAVDESGTPTTNKMLPVLGVWQAGAFEEAPTVSETYFNTSATATTRIQASVLTSGTLAVGIADYRGDGRPDFRYSAHLLYGDKLSPARVSTQAGSAVTVKGLGFASTTQVTINGLSVPTATAAPNHIIFFPPALVDGVYSLSLRDSANGATSQMSNVLMVGSAGAKLVLITGANPQVPVGTEAPNAILVRVVDGSTGSPIAGATVRFNAPSSVTLVGCVLNPCPIVSDQSGYASVRVIVKQAGASVITASLQTGGSLSATVNGMAAPLEIGLQNSTVYTAAGATLTVPIVATVVQNGSATAGKTVNFLLNAGTATIEKTSVATGLDGVATSAVTITSITSDVNLSTCVAPANSPCRNMLIHPVPDSALRLQRVSGDGQMVPAGRNFAPLVIQVTDATGDPVFGSSVTYDVHVFQAAGETTQTTSGETVTTSQGQPVVLSSAVKTTTSDMKGLTSISIDAPSQPVRVAIRALAGATELDLELNAIWMDLAVVESASRSTGAAQRNSRLQRTPQTPR